MMTVNGWYEGRGGGGVSKRIGEMSDPLIMVLHGEIWKDFRPNVVQPLLENIDRRSCNDGNCKLIPVFFDSNRKGRTPSPATALTLKNLVGVLS